MAFVKINEKLEIIGKEEYKKYLCTKKPLMYFTISSSPCPFLSISYSETLARTRSCEHDELEKSWRLFTPFRCLTSRPYGPLFTWKWVLLTYIPTSPSRRRIICRLISFRLTCNYVQRETGVKDLNMRTDSQARVLKYLHEGLMVF